MNEGPRLKGVQRSGKTVLIPSQHSAFHVYGSEPNPVELVVHQDQPTNTPIADPQAKDALIASLEEKIKRLEAKIELQTDGMEAANKVIARQLVKNMKLEEVLEGKEEDLRQAKETILIQENQIKSLRSAIQRRSEAEEEYHYYYNRLHGDFNELNAKYLSLLERTFGDQSLVEKQTYQSSESKQNNEQPTDDLAQSVTPQDSYFPTTYEEVFAWLDNGDSSGTLTYLAHLHQCSSDVTEGSTTYVAHLEQSAFTDSNEGNTATTQSKRKRD